MGFQTNLPKIRLQLTLKYAKFFLRGEKSSLVTRGAVEIRPRRLASLDWYFWIEHLESWRAAESVDTLVFDSIEHKP